MSFQKFNPSLGTLTGIQFSLTGDVNGSAQVESLDGSPSTVTSTLAASITLTRPDLSTLVVALPTLSSIDNLSAFDGIIDFGGTSGASHSGSSFLTAFSGILSGAGDLALFTGPGSIVLPISATGASTASGAGNLLTLFSTQAGANASVTYTYNSSVVPEPSTTGLIGLGFAAIGMLGRKLRARS